MKMKLQKSLTGLTLVLLLVGLNYQKSFAHCEIPCGIYADSVRITLIKEHITTIEKSMNQIEEISQSSKPNYNQLVRWVNNKEEHAMKIQEIVSQYFLHQRIKIVDETQKCSIPRDTPASNAHDCRSIAEIKCLHSHFWVRFM